MAAVLQDPPRSRLSIALGAALALHATTAFFGYRIARSDVTGVLDAAPPLETEIELFDTRDETRGSEVVDTDEVPRSAALAMSTQARERQHRVDPGVGPPEGPPAAPPPEGSGGEQGSYALDSSAHATEGAISAGVPVQLGIGAGDWSRWVDPTAAPVLDTSRPELQPAPASSTGGLAEALEARDQGLGLGPAGAVLTAVHQAGYSEIAPALGTATFSITVLRSGVVNVQLTGASSQSDAWSQVGDSIAAAIRRKPPRISPSRIGVRLGIEVVAEERWPNGQPTRLDSGPKVAVAPPKFRPTETAKEALLDRNPAAVPEPDAPSDKPPLQANFESPGVYVQGRGKVCSYKVGLSLIPISGGCDPANIGAPPRRVVSTRVISQTML